MNIDVVENKALRFGVIMSVVMAFAGWITYYFSGSEATLLDGNFSFISAIATIVAMFISKHKHEQSKIFPFGFYVFESLFVFIKGILIFGVILVAVTQNTIKIIDFIKGENIEPVKIDIILIYVGAITILCFILYFYYNFMNKKIGGKSPILKVETQSAMVDGILSLGIGVVFVCIWFIPENSSLDFFKSIGDAIIVLIIGVLFITMPIKIIRDSFIEMGGGTIQNKSVQEFIEKAIEESIPSTIENLYNYISKLGSSYFIAVFVASKSDQISSSEIDQFRKKAIDVLNAELNNVKLEVIIRNQSDIGKD